VIRLKKSANGAECGSLGNAPGDGFDFKDEKR
jgi:hypothetical protein